MLKRNFPIFILFLLTVLIFSSGLPGEFVIEDIQNIRHNPSLADSNLPGFILNRIGDFLFDSKANPPIIALTYWVDLRLWGFNPWGFRITNLAIHLLVIILLFNFLRRHFFDDDILKSTIGAGFFALNPITIYAIRYISGRTALLMGFFGIASILLYASYRRKKSYLKIVGLTISLIMAFLSNANAIVILPALFAFDAFIRSNRRALVPFIILTLFVFAGLILRTSIAQSNLAGWGWSIIVNVPFLFMNNMATLFFPIGASPFDTPESFFAGSLVAILSGIVFLLIYHFVLYLFWRKGGGKSTYAMILVTLFLLPSLPIVKHDSIDFSSIYPAIIGGCIIFAITLRRIGDMIRKKWPNLTPEIVLGILVFILFANTTFIDNFKWINAVSLAREHLDNRNISVPALSSLANSMLEIGEYDSAGVLANHVVAIDSGNTAGWRNLANAYSGMEMNKAALWATNRWARISGNKSPEWQYTTGVVYMKMGKTKRGKQSLARASEKYAPAQLFLGKLYFDEGHYEKSIEILELAIENDPFNAKIHYLLADAYEAVGNNEDALKAWRRYLELPGIKTPEFIGYERLPGVLPGEYMED